MGDIYQVLLEYEKKYSIVGRAHYIASDRYFKYHRFLGMPAVVIGALVGTAIFASLNGSPEVWVRILVGVFSLLSAALSALQTFLEFSQMAARHKVAAGKYQSIKRFIKVMKLKYPDNTACRQDWIADLQKLNQKLDVISEASPSIPDDCYDRAQKEYIADLQNENTAASATNDSIAVK